MTFDYLLAIFFMFFSAALSFILFLIFYLLIFRQIDFEKISAYECGFNPFEDAYGRFDIQFYLVAILFLIFDLEFMFLIPWSIMVFYVNIFCFYSMLLFLFLLIIGFLYEWRRGALDW